MHAQVCTEKDNSIITRKGGRPRSTCRTGGFLLVSKDLSGPSKGLTVKPTNREAILLQRLPSLDFLNVERETVGG